MSELLAGSRPDVPPVDSPEQSESATNIDAEWASLGGEQHDTFNPSPESTESISNQEETMGTGQEFAEGDLSTDIFGQEQVEDPADTERRLHYEVMNAGEIFTKNERAAYNEVGVALSRLGYETFAKSVGKLGADTADADENRFGHVIVDFIDAKASSDPEAAKAQAELRDKYQNASEFRAKALEDTLSGIHIDLIFLNNPNFDYTTRQLSEMKQIPEAQMQLTQKYFEYFDDPSEEHQKELNRWASEYVEYVNNQIYRLTQTLKNTELQESLGDIAGVVSQHYSKLHESIMQYCKHKLEHPSAASQNTEQPPVPQSADTTPDLQSPAIF